MFKKNYFYLLEYYDNNNEKQTKAGILEKTKRVKTYLDMRLVLIKIIADIEEEIENYLDKLRKKLKEELKNNEILHIEF